MFFTYLNNYTIRIRIIIYLNLGLFLVYNTLSVCKIKGLIADEIKTEMNKISNDILGLTDSFGKWYF